jgi:Uncharacterized conserved protein
VIDEGPGAEWRSADAYADLFSCDRRFFAWEWLRRSPAYRRLWRNRDRLPRDALSETGLVDWVDPAIAAPHARPIWNGRIDPAVLDGHPVEGPQPNVFACDLFDIRSVAPFVSVAVDSSEHWLVSDGRWVVRLDLHDGTLLGGPLLIEHRMAGLQSVAPKLAALRRLIALAANGALPSSMTPRERRAGQWILELRVADALLAGATQQEIARRLYYGAVSAPDWRIENAAYRSRVQRLVRKARRQLARPLAGPWFER